MSKLFYTNPVKAIWMHREFGVKFLNNQEPDNLAMEAPLWEMTEEIIGNGGTYAPWYVHPDSYAVFEPKAGDVLEHSYADFLSEEIRRQVGIACIDACRDVDVYEQGIELRSCCSLENIKIIQRDNKAFFSPEVEL